MNASIFPSEAASKQSKGCMICPPGKTSMWKRPPLVSSTSLANCRAAACTVSADGGNAVDMRHWIFGCAMTLGASTMTEAAAAATTPPAVTMNLRRSVIPVLPRDEPMVGALGDVIPRTHQRLELRERGV